MPLWVQKILLLLKLNKPFRNSLDYLKQSKSWFLLYSRQYVGNLDIICTLCWTPVLCTRRARADYYFLTRLRSFNVCSTMLRMFYQPVVTFAIFFAVMCWDSRVRAVDDQRTKQAHQEGWLCAGGGAWFFGGGVRQSLSRMLRCLRSILDSDSHPLHDALVTHRSTFSNRLLPPRGTTERHRKSFLPVDIQQLIYLRQREVNSWGGSSLHFSSALFCAALLTLNLLFLWIIVSLWITTII